MKKTVALIYGGEGVEGSISRCSAKNLYSMISKEKYEVIPVFISHGGSWYISDTDPFGALPTRAARPTYPVMLHGRSGLLSEGGIKAVDVAFPTLHGDFGEDGIIQGALDAAHIRYVGCKVGAGALCADKIYTKAVADGLGIRTARWIAECGMSAEDRKRARQRTEELLGFPVFIKPSCLGSSVGASAVYNGDSFDKAYISAARFGGRVLIEELIPVAYEVECAFLSYGKEKLYSASGIVQTDGAVYGFAEKYDINKSPKTLHGVGATPLKAEIEACARALGEVLSLRHMARLDFLVGDDGEIYFNEVNTIPGMTPTSLYPALTEDMGLSRGEFVELLIEDATK